jgi:hypothetical protein
LARRFVRKVAITAVIEGHVLLVMALDVLARNRLRLEIAILDIHSGWVHCGGVQCGGVRIRVWWGSRGGEKAHQRLDFRRDIVGRVLPKCCREDLIEEGVAYVVMPAKKLPLAAPAMEEM